MQMQFNVECPSKNSAPQHRLCELICNVQHILNMLVTIQLDTQVCFKACSSTAGRHKVILHHFMNFTILAHTQDYEVATCGTVLLVSKLDECCISVT